MKAKISKTRNHLRWWHRWILVSKEEAHSANKSFKYFIGYDDNDDIRPLCIMLP